jgi:hypothetical protein
MLLIKKVYASMKIALIFYGFLRTETFSQIKELKRHDVEVYYCIPDKLDEFSTNNVTQEHINKIKEVYGNGIITTFKYDAQQFIKKSKDLNLAMINTSNLFNYRIISAINSLSMSCKLVINDNYDLFIITRVDKTNCVSNIPLIANKNLMIRTVPYIATIDIEDRFMICKSEVVKLFSQMYDNIDSIEISLFLEQILYYYLKDKEIQLENQLGIGINMTEDFKYRPEFRENCVNEYNNSDDNDDNGAHK